MMAVTVQSLLPVLPRFSDDSGYDVKIVFWDGKHLYAFCDYCRLDDVLDAAADKEVIRILPGLTRIGGEYDETLHIVVSKVN